MPLIAVTLLSPDAVALREAAARVKATLGADLEPLGPEALDLFIDGDAALIQEALDRALADLPVDLCVQPAAGRRKRLLVADMDSTIIGCECIDELADYAGVKSQVAAITERAMAGALAFEPALRERVALLRGLPLETLARCLNERVRLNPGAQILVRTMAAHGARCLLVSGGFTAFAEPVAALAGFHEARANRLLDDGACLTGEVAEPILGRDAKLQALRDAAATHDIPLSETLAVGDGANDLAMIEAAGLGVAYRAKPVAAARAALRLDHADLSALLYVQGYHADEFVRS